MTLEQREYGAGWVRCARCTVHDALSRRTWDPKAKVYRCTDVAQCDLWIAELTAAGLVAGKAGK